MVIYRRCFVFFSFVIFFGGCTMIPKYQRPESPVSNEWPVAVAEHLEGGNPEKQIDADTEWQQFYAEPRLIKVIEMALNNNRDLRLAALNVARARAMYGVEIAELFPVIDAKGSAARQKLSSDLLYYDAPKIIDQYEVNLGVASWEIDFFGRIRSLAEQVLQEYLATEQAHRSAKVLLLSEVSRAYFALASNRDKLHLAQATLEAQQSVLGLVSSQVAAGLASEIDQHRAKTQVDTAKVDVAMYTRLEAQSLNALNLLAGVMVPEELLPNGLEDITQLTDISVGLPSEVLLKRPDIIAAEHKLKGAYAFIGVARAAFFPRIGLTTAAGTASNELSNLFKSGTNTWTFAPQVVVPIFDTRTWAAYKVSKATQEIALVEYEKTIQAAFREVADVLAVRETIDQQIVAQQSLVDSALSIFDLADQRYKTGISSYFNVLDAQKTLYAAQQGLASLQLTRADNRIKMYAALGGGK